MQLIIRSYPTLSYEPVWHAMRDFSKNKEQEAVDELWFLEHSPVYTFGQAGKPEHLLNKNHIETIRSDRGGQITYHGPGQLIIYPLFNIRRMKIGIKRMVCLLEQVVIDLLRQYSITGIRKTNAPGVYIDTKKIASIGLRVTNGSTYHGLALNINADLSPFEDINPCGYSGLEMTNLSEHVPHVSRKSIEQFLSQSIIEYFNFESYAVHANSIELPEYFNQ